MGCEPSGALSSSWILKRLIVPMADFTSRRDLLRVSVVIHLTIVLDRARGISRVSASTTLEGIMKARTTVLAAGCATLAAVGIAGAAIPAPDGAITGCYQTANGNLRVIDGTGQ